MLDPDDTVVLYEELAFQDVMPVRWDCQPPEPAAAVGLAERNLLVMQAWDALEDHAVLEKADENAPLAAEIQRLDRKMTLLLALVGQLLALNRPRPAPVPLRFNARGALWRPLEAAPQAGAQGILEIYLHECIAQPLRLRGRITAVAATGEVKVHFDPHDDALCSVITKITFRRHRRQIAGRHASNRAS